MVNHIEKRTWSSLDSVIFFIRILWIVFNISINLLPINIDSNVKILIILWFLAILKIPYIFFRPGHINIPYYLITEFILTGSMFIFLVSQFHNVGSEILSIISFPIFTIAFVSQSRPIIWISPILSSALILSGGLIGGFFVDKDTFGRFFDTLVLYGFGFMLGRISIMSQNRKELIDSIREKNKTLEQYAKRIEEMVIKEERSRVSRDMHDTVGIIFTSIIASLDALPYIIKANQEAAITSIKELSFFARNGLADVRKTIHQLKGKHEEKKMTEICDSLIKDFSSHTGTLVEFQIIGNEIEIGESTKYALIRSLQESLTNAKRHGQSTQIKVTIQFFDLKILLCIKDNGIGFDPIHYGFGLNSMKERLIILGGSLQIESYLNKGTTITCTVPVPKEYSS